MSGAKWVDLARFGARLELVPHPLLRTRRLRLLIEDRALFHRTILGRPWETLAPDQRREASAKFKAALDDLGFNEDAQESLQRFIRAGGSVDYPDGPQPQRPAALYSDQLTVTNAQLLALIPDLRAGDIVAANLLEPKGTAFKFIADREFLQSIANGDGIHFRVDDDNRRPVPLAQAPTLYMPSTPQPPIERFLDRARAENILASRPALDAFRADAEQGVIEAWFSQADCFAALALDPSDAAAVTRVDWPYSVPVGYRAATRSLFVIADARYDACDLDLIKKGHLRRAVMLRERVNLLAERINLAAEESELGAFPRSAAAMAAMTRCVQEVDVVLGELAVGDLRDIRNGRQYARVGTAQQFGFDWRWQALGRAVTHACLPADLAVAQQAVAHLQRIDTEGRKLELQAAEAAAQRAIQAVGTPIAAHEQARHDDVGQKIGGARKDFFAQRLTPQDLEDMNDVEKRALVTKQNIWKPLDYAAMRDAGVAPQAAYAVKWIKDRIHPAPEHAALAEAYVRAVAIIRDEFDAIRSVEHVRQACMRVRERFAEIDPQSADWSYTYASAVHRAIGSSAALLLAEPNKAILNAFYRTAEGSSWANLIRESGTAGKRKERDDSGRFRPQRPHLDQLERSGPAWRGGDIDGDLLLRTFGFRGIEYGNWLPQGERQLVLNHAFDAFMDLAAALRLPPRAISLGGELAIAFGARGKGKAEAHFEPGRFVINLTRIKGAGTVAHEWGHALDRWLALDAQSAEIFLTHSAASSVARQTAPHLGAMAQAMRALSSAPIGIDDALERQMATVLESARCAKRNILGFATYDNYTGFAAAAAGERAAGRGAYLRHVGELLEHAFAWFSDDALRAEGAAAVGERYAASQLPLRIGELYVDSGGGKRAFRLSTSHSIEGWFDSVRRDLERLAFLERAKAQGARFEPQNERSRDKDGGFTECRCAATAYLASAKALDAKRAKPYFSQPEELFARAFEALVFDAIEEKGETSEYLVHGVEESRYASGYAGNPYPVGQERASFNQELRNAFDVLRIELIHAVERSCAKTAGEPRELDLAASM